MHIFKAPKKFNILLSETMV